MGIYGLTGCAGDQLAILNDEALLLSLAQLTHIVDFGMASSEAGVDDAPLDLAIVEGAVCSKRDLRVLRAIRARATRLMALGSCALFGGLPAMDAQTPLAMRRLAVYGNAPSASLDESLPAAPLSDYVMVDYAIPGCPIETRELADALARILAGGEPLRHDAPVCADCRLAENVCLAQRGDVCCGPLTRGGCGARCVGFGQACRGCRGPVDDPAFDRVALSLMSQGLGKEQAIAAMQRFSAPAWTGERLAGAFEEDPRHLGVGRKPKPPRWTTESIS
ncbi:putative NADH ubiquinone oxidoreductase, 20 kDa subunit [Magnetofaba australis IT-1]|uniref:Putative NADH ubiquinone oxidoreductase, 20 kDa subunit n=1 Tax=Magnetofaba australis IT-1 TaxID=1434232 RepID=A0A1Y2K5H1_9PROT|nr:putative NADH ubiquinone oxidoreductase, 20 kDa subunit [Magnetofaba australis IT-1]